ncbi:MAG TPA: hypothetical protein VFG47_07380 [Geminicoccaceae bacterium]|nr:hypothetical protein [Geminicoccaceae bacterium]
MTREIFADTFGRIDFLGGVVRIELIAIDPDPQVTEGQLRMSARHRLIMPLDGFLHACGTMNDLVRQLNEQRAQQEGAAAAGQPAAQGTAGDGGAATGAGEGRTGETAAGGDAPRPASPNF